MKSPSELSAVGQLVGLSGRKEELASLARGCGVRYHTARGWWYYSKVPKYPAVERCKQFLLSVAHTNVTDPIKLAEIEAAIHDLYRRAA